MVSLAAGHTREPSNANAFPKGNYGSYARDAVADAAPEAEAEPATSAKTTTTTVTATPTPASYGNYGGLIPSFILQCPRRCANVHLQEITGTMANMVGGLSTVGQAQKTSANEHF